MPKSICDAPGCTRPLRLGDFMCPEHWYRLPREHRTAIDEAWQDRHGDCGFDPLRDARAAAVAWLRANPSPAAAQRAAIAERVQQGAYWHD